MRADIVEDMCDAQSSLVQRLGEIGWKAHTKYVERKREAKTRHSLRAMRLRLHSTPVRTCRNPKCGAVFVPYRKNIGYCTNACCARHLALAAYYRRRVVAPARACVVCGAQHARKVGAVYCSKSCCQKALLARISVAPKSEPS